jgi:predicted nucleic acid-binding protein
VIVVDTSVWIEYLSTTSTEPAVQFLHETIEQKRDRFAYTDVVLAEILQGLRDDQDAARIEDYLSEFQLLMLTGLDDFRRAAALYRQARSKGVTIRRTSDCLIASVCIREDVPLLHRDADFDRLAETTDLKVVELPASA